jgi:hypothetical protein
MSDVKPWRCIICGNEYRTQLGLSRHINVYARHWEDHWIAGGGIQSIPITRPRPDGRTR